MPKDLTPQPAAPAEPAAPVEPASAEPAPVEPSSAEPAPVEPASAEPEPLTDDPALNAELVDGAIEIPTGERLVPESRLGRQAQYFRNKLKEARQTPGAQADLQARLDAAEAKLRQTEPLAIAFSHLQHAQVQQPQQPTEEQVRELQEIARDYDFYDGEGKLDLNKAARHQQRVRKEAQAVAAAQTAPLVRHTLSGQANHNIARAKATVHPVTNQKADPAIIDRLVSHLAQQPGGLETLANPETVKQIWLNAYALSTFAPAAAPAAPAAPPPPVVSETSGGRAPGKQVALSPAEKAAAKSVGMTEAQYLETAKGMRW